MPHLYCSACNELFSTENETCPRCGMRPSTSMEATLDTVLLPHDGDDSAAASTDLQLDDLLLDGQVIDIYECQKMLGRGGMGVVYLARNQMLHRLCALKVLSPRRASHSIDYVERFENEGRAAAALVHPNIVTTHAIGRCDGRYFLEMEYVSGSSLQKEIEKSGSIGAVRATQMAVGVAEGLAAAHRLGIVHRDLKPDNVLVTPAGYPKIADFGLAKQVHSRSLGQTRLAGTPHFMAPELLEGAEATPASDVFALGVCYYLMLTGHYPFEGDSLTRLMAATLSGEYVSVRRRNADVPLDVAECVGLMLQHDPNARPASGSAISQLLQAVLGDTRDLETLLYEAFHGIPSIRYESIGAGASVELRLPNNRQQTIHLSNSDHRAGDRLLNIYSVCCEARPDFYEQALRLNAVVLHGGLAIRDVDGTPCFVMVDTYPRATVSAEEIRRSVIEVGARADEIERLLTGRDIN